jgi:hypothetical protein
MTPFYPTLCTGILIGFFLGFFIGLILAAVVRLGED